MKVSYDQSFLITISGINKCNEGEFYPISVSDLHVQIQNGIILVSGTLSTSVDLQTVKAYVKAERKAGFIWIKIPCIQNVGSCVYEDLCEFGESENDVCPNNFLENNVPCRCPIPKGTYTLPHFLSLPLEPHFGYDSIVKGKYWAKIQLEQYGNTLACYQIYFSIQDNVNRNAIHEQNGKPSVLLIK
ncbi:hypothetical protein JTB14_034532 [Gonioctena quinquepunctata]|nr:hypothetical protein JTB14_034532 [Gonioctena quinquepunctata]